MTVLRTQLQAVARRPARLLLTGLAVLVASFVVFATVLSYQIVTKLALDSLSGTSDSASLVIEAYGDKGLSTDGVAKLRALPGVTDIAARTGTYLTPPGDTAGNGFILAADTGKGALSEVKLVQGSFPTRPNEVAVSARTVTRANLKPGSTLTLALSGEPNVAVKTVTYTVTGVVEARGDNGHDLYAQPATVIAVSPQGFYRVDIAATGDVEGLRAAATEALRSSVPDAQVMTGAEKRDQEARRATSDLNAVYATASVFVVIAVLAAGMVATSTFRIVFAQRLRQLALLRAVGAGRGKLMRALAAEGLLVGFVSGLVGVLGAAALGQVVPWVAKGFGATIAAPGLPLLAALAVVLGAMLVTLLAVIAPAISAARVAPLEALRAAATTGGRKGVGAVRMVAGILCALVAAGSAAFVWSQLPDLKEASNAGYDPLLPMMTAVFSGAMAFGALLALGPVILRPVLAVVGWPLRRLGPLGRLAVGGVGGAPRRAAAVSVVVALGVTLIAGVLVGAASLRTLADREMALSAPADFGLTAAGELPASTISRLKAAKELKDVVTYRRLEVHDPRDTAMTYQVSDLDLAGLPAMQQVDTSSGSLDDITAGKVLVSGWAVESLNAKIGDPVELVGAGGQRLTVTVAATMTGEAPLGGQFTVAPSDLDKLGAKPGATGALANAVGEGEQGRAAGITAVNNAMAGAQGTQLEVLADLRDEVDKVLTAVLAIALGLVGLTVIIAVVGVGTTTALSVVERIRESGLLRAVGVSRTGLRVMLTTEAGLYGVIGATLGLGIGVPYSWLLVLAMGVEAPLELPFGQLAGVFVVLTLLTAAAGVLPARKAAKVSPVSALGSDE